MSFQRIATKPFNDFLKIELVKSDDFIFLGPNATKEKYIEQVIKKEKCMLFANTRLGIFHVSRYIPSHENMYFLTTLWANKDCQIGATLKTPRGTQTHNVKYYASIAIAKKLTLKFKEENMIRDLTHVSSRTIKNTTFFTFCVNANMLDRSQEIPKWNLIEDPKIKQIYRVEVIIYGVLADMQNLYSDVTQKHSHDKQITSIMACRENIFEQWDKICDVRNPQHNKLNCV